MILVCKAKDWCLIFLFLLNRPISLHSIVILKKMAVCIKHDTQRNEVFQCYFRKIAS